MYTRTVLMVVFWRYRMPFDAHGCVSTLMNVTYAKILIERDRGIDVFEVGVNDSIFSGNEQQRCNNKGERMSLH